MSSSLKTTTLFWGGFLLVVIIMVNLNMSAVQGQVNFSPAWGKRGGSAPGQAPFPGMRGSGGSGGGEEHLLGTTDCKLPFEGVVRVLKLIQMEAQRLIRCEGTVPQTEGTD